MTDNSYQLLQNQPVTRQSDFMNMTQIKYLFNQGILVRYDYNWFEMTITGLTL